ncbi:MAG: GFA family protein [Halioglobus sp.]
MITGRCECGGVAYQVAGDIHDYSHCHCSQCRRLHGAAFASFAGVAREAFNYLPGKNRVASYASSSTHSRVFCPTCGSNIMVELTSEPNEVYIAMGTMDGELELPPGYHIYVGSKASWHSIGDNLPQYETEPEE